MRKPILFVSALLLSACATQPPAPVTAQDAAPVVCAYDDELLLPFIQTWLQTRQRLAQPGDTP